MHSHPLWMPYTCMSPVPCMYCALHGPCQDFSSFWGWRDLSGHGERFLLQQHPL